MDGIHPPVYIEKQMFSEQFILLLHPEGCSQSGMLIVEHNEVPAT